jgi:glycosyltransferase involved in cell wall biosynthesis
MRARPRLAIVATHPIQYYAPWFVHLAGHLRAQVQVFYLWDFGVALRHDPGFDQDIRWDVDLLSGYEHRFVSNSSKHPGTHSFLGLRNASLVPELHAWKPDAILLFGYRYWSHLRVIGSWKLRGIPLLFRGDSHLLAEPLGALPKTMKRCSLHLLFRRFAAFLPVGQSNAVYFQRHGVASKKLFHAPHAVDNDRFASSGEQTEKAARLWRRHLKIPCSHRVILFAGKFEAKKRPEDLIRAFLASDIPEATLLLVGAGPLESNLRNRAGKHPHIRFAPFQNQSAMPRVYAAADLVVLPSAGPGETWGLVINEACCVGRAVLVSDHTGCHPDLVQKGKNGLIFRAGDVGALGAALTEALSDNTRLREWGAASREIIQSFTYSAATEGLQQALNFILPECAV